LSKEPDASYIEPNEPFFLRVCRCSFLFVIQNASDVSRSIR